MNGKDVLISRGALLEDIKTAIDRYHNKPETFGAHAVTFAQIVREQPAVEAKPVQHGRWDTSLDGITPFCTECSHTHHCMTRLPKYCPNCGAKMDGGAEE